MQGALFLSFIEHDEITSKICKWIRLLAAKFVKLFSENLIEGWRILLLYKIVWGLEYQNSVSFSYFFLTLLIYISIWICARYWKGKTNFKEKHFKYEWKVNLKQFICYTHRRLYNSITSKNTMLGKNILFNKEKQPESWELKFHRSIINIVHGSKLKHFRNLRINKCVYVECQLSEKKMFHSFYTFWAPMKV